MPYSDQTTRRKLSAAAMRRLRLYRRALAAGHPKALAAEAAKDYMRPFNALRAEKDKLPEAERERLKTAPAGERLSRANLQRVYAECCRARDENRYARLRAEVIAELEMLS